MTRNSRYCCVLFMICISGRTNLSAEESLIRNGSLSAWTNGVPDGWEVSIGAQNGMPKKSLLVPIKGGGVRLGGDASTGKWRLLSQDFSATPDRYYRVTFEARVAKLKRERKQYNNCYLGVFCEDANGKRLAVEKRNLYETNMATGQLVLRIPKNTARAKLMVFLSMSGTLEVRNIAVNQLEPSDGFDVLVDAMDRYYSYFDHKKINWKELTEKYRERGTSADTPKKFVAVIRPMLVELKDMHVWIDLPDGKRIPSHISKVDRNANFKAVAGQLKNVQQFGRFGFVGRTANGYGYVAVGSMSGNRNDFAKMEQAVASMFDARGLIVDLRGNGGGAEPLGQSMASMFNEKARPYAYSKIRSGEKHTDLLRNPNRMLPAGKGKIFTRPILCLIGPGCVSSGEGFALMMKSLPQVVLVGQPTRGASGNPAPVLLPNGVTVYFSRWVAYLLDGTVLEGRGVQPDVVVDHKGSGDPTFTKAAELLKKAVEK